LEELEEIGGGRHQGREEDEEMASWVSDFCVKSVIVGLLNLLEKELHGSLAVVRTTPLHQPNHLPYCLHSGYQASHQRYSWSRRQPQQNLARIGLPPRNIPLTLTLPVRIRPCLWPSTPIPPRLRDTISTLCIPISRPLTSPFHS
jgi:hypothetical protein